MSVQRGDTSTLQHVERLGIVAARNERREPSSTDLSVQLSQVVLQEVHDAIRPDGVDSSDVQERTATVQAREPPEVTKVAGRTVLVHRGPVLLPGFPVHQVPGSILLKPEVVVSLEYLRH